MENGKTFRGFRRGATPDGVPLRRRIEQKIPKTKKHFVRLHYRTDRIPWRKVFEGG
jgi:hypothetical protein